MNNNKDIPNSIKILLEQEMQSNDSPESITTKILEELDRLKVLYYSEKGRSSLLNIHGRVLIAILEDPGITQRALSQYLQVSESNIQKSVQILARDGLITKEKNGKRNTYRFNVETGVQHPDIHRFYNQIKKQIEPW